MKNFILTLALSLLGVAGVAQAAPPACVTNAMASLPVPTSCFNTKFRPITLTIHRKNNSWVAYSTGTIGKTSNGDLASSALKQLFSDRVTGTQPFDVAKPDSQTLRFRASDGQLTLHNSTWNFDTVLTPSCSGNLITASDGSNFYLISYGAVDQLVC